VRRTLFAAIVACTTVAIGSTPSPARESGIRIQRDIRYTVVSGTELHLDAYLPRGDGPHPAVLVIPGGRWMFIDKGKDDWLPTELARRGIAAFAVNYRPSTEAPFPAPFRDVQAAVRFVRDGADRFSIDPERIGAVGGSSGGHLAALLATWGEGPTDRGTRVSVAISWSGPMELGRLLRQPREDVVNAVATFLGCVRGDRCEDVARTASPIAHVDPTDGAIYLANSFDEVIPVQQAERMASALERSGVPHQLFLVDAGHGLGAARSDKGFEPAAAFLGEWLEGEGGADATGLAPSATGEKPGEGAASSRAEDEAKDDPPVARPAVPSASPGWLPVLTLLALALAVSSSVAAMMLFRRLRAISAGGDIEPGTVEGSSTSAQRDFVGSRPGDGETTGP
jgi:acetyl esterase